MIACPKCEREPTRVVTRQEKRVKTRNETVRLRSCPACGHRFYTVERVLYARKPGRPRIYKRPGPETIPPVMPD